MSLQEAGGKDSFRQLLSERPCTQKSLESTLSIVEPSHMRDGHSILYRGHIVAPTQVLMKGPYPRWVYQRL